MSISERGSGAKATGTGTAVSVDVSGLGISAGDMVWAAIHVNGTSTTITSDDGFTDDFQEQNGSETSAYAIQKKDAGASEPTTYGWTLGASVEWSVQVRVFYSTTTGKVVTWDVAPSASTRSSSTGSATATAPSITTSTDGALGIVLVVTDSSTITYSAPTNGYGSEVEPTAHQCQVSYTKALPTAGATGSTSVTLSASNDWTAHQIAIHEVNNPAAAFSGVSYSAALPFPKEAGLHFDGRYFSAWAYTGDGTVEKAIEIAHIDSEGMTAGTAHTIPGGPSSDITRGYHCAFAGRFWQTYGDLNFYIANSLSHTWTSAWKAHEDLNASDAVDNYTSINTFVWPAAIIDAAQKPIIGGRTQSPSPFDLKFQRASDVFYRYDMTAWDTPVTVKAATGSTSNMQIVAYENGDIGFVIGVGQEPGTLSYRHGTWDPDTDTYTLEAEQTITSDAGAYYTMRAVPMRDGRLVLIWRKYDAAPAYNTLRYAVRSAGSSGVWDGTGDSVAPADLATDLYGTAHTEGYFTSCANLGQTAGDAGAKLVYCFYYDGTDIVQRTWDGTSWSAKSTVVAGPSLSEHRIQSAHVSVEKTGVVYHTTDNKIWVQAVGMPVTDATADENLIPSVTDSRVGTNDFNQQAATYGDRTVMVWRGMGGRPRGGVYNHTTAQWEEEDVPFGPRYADGHNMTYCFVGPDGYIYLCMGGRSFVQDLAPVILKTDYPLGHASFSLSANTDISPGQTYDGKAGNRGYKFLYVDRLGVIYYLYLYHVPSATPDPQRRIGVIEYRNGTWSAETKLMEFDDDFVAGDASAPYIQAVSGGREDATWTITDVTDAGASATVTVTDATGLANGTVVQITGTGTALDDTARPISGLSGNQFTYPLDPAGSSSTGTASEQDSILLLWSYINKANQPSTSVGSVTQNELNFARVVPQGSGSFKGYKASGSEMTLPMDLAANNDRIYRWNGTTQNIVSTNAGTDEVEVTGHGFTTGQTIWIDGSTCTPSIDGKRTVTVVDANHFTVGVDITTGGGAAGTVSPDWEYVRLGGSVEAVNDNGTLRPLVTGVRLDTDSPYGLTRYLAHKWDGAAWTTVDIDTTGDPERPTTQATWDPDTDTVFVAAVMDYGGVDEIVTYQSLDQGETWRPRKRRTNSPISKSAPLISPNSTGKVNLMWDVRTSRLHGEVGWMLVTTEVVAAYKSLALTGVGV